ncbi:MAG: immunoglobulin domain-containing protein [Verrucomicrobia bacterium]|nr:immunoglobulin domain-containing protein [Verrucomicrobiota bacterium]
MITQQPRDLTVYRGETAAFTVGISGTPPFQYQWFYVGQILPGETNAVLVLVNVTTSQGGVYNVEVTNPSGLSIGARTAYLTVIVPIPPVLTEPAQGVSAVWGSSVTFSPIVSGSAPFEYQWLFGTNATVELGGTAVFSVAVKGTEPIEYQWFFGTNSLAGQTKPTLALSNVTVNLAGEYKVTVSDPSGVTISSSSVRLIVTVPTPPAITRQPQDQTVNVDETAMFAVEARGSEPLRYQWFAGSRSLSGESSATLTLRNVATNQAGVYRVIVSNAYGSVSSSNVTLVVKDALAPPANDLFANRTPLTGLALSVTNSNANATREAGEPNHADNAGGRSLWWTWTAPQNGSVTISTAGSSVDTVLAVYTGSTLSSLTALASNDDDPSGGTTSLGKFPARAGVAYQIAVDTFGGQTGTIHLSLTAEIERPALRVSLSGRNVVLSWPTNAVGFSLQVSDRLGATWSRVSQDAVVTGENFSVKLPLGSSNQFFRLSGP